MQGQGHTPGMIFTMNLDEETYKSRGYPEVLKQTPKSMGEIMGYCETLNIYNTYQFRDYSKYDLGCRIAQKAKSL